MKVADVLQDDQVVVLETEAVQALPGHLGIQVAHTSGMQLDGLDARRLLDLDGIDVAVDVRLHHGDTQLVLQQVDGPYEGGRFPATGRG